MKKQDRAKRVVAVVLGAGQSTRMGHPINKVFLPINGKPVIIYALETFEHCPLVDDVLLVAAAGEEEALAKLARAAHCHKVQQVIHGGATRHASEQCALDALRPAIDASEVEIVLIHDGARPFISVERVQRLIERAREVGGAILATPLQEEEVVVEVEEQRIQRSFEGQQAWKAQTPQAFQASLLLNAYDQARRDQFYGTDTAASLERIGSPVALVESDLTNIKITTAHDLFHAEKLSHQRRF
ncbi:MAG: 2-C-methyl-D-erythritol 4-phosphate cytidylyltransferase [Ktedonobacteraceae bacterium]|nr:2-C-methyl-D-erythritol 4-phosphate cytidylyltransferase [Ktedonobacteraceae bacterium]